MEKKSLNHSSQDSFPPVPSNPPVGSLWKHFKGNVYIISDIARDCEEPGRFLVVYRSMKGDVWVRPLENFLEKHESGVQRFEQITESCL